MLCKIAAGCEIIVRPKDDFSVLQLIYFQLIKRFKRRGKKVFLHGTLVFKGPNVVRQLV